MVIGPYQFAFLEFVQDSPFTASFKETSCNFVPELSQIVKEADGETRQAAKTPFKIWSIW